MENYKKRLHSKRALTFVSTLSEAFYEGNEEVYALLKARNFPILYYYSMKHNDKERAISLLLERESKFRSVAIINEIVRVFLYFQDYEGALEYIKRSKQFTKELLHYEFLIQIHLSPKNAGCQDSNVFNLVKKGLECRFDRSFIEVMKEYLKNNCGLCFHECIKSRFREIQNIIEHNHYHALSYEDAKFCYKTMPKKDVFLHKMIKTNPFIKKKYYLEYADIYGIQKEDIMNMLTTKFRNWVADIALFFGWIDEKQRLSYDKHKSRKPIAINRNSNWKYKKDGIFSFKNVL